MAVTVEQALSAGMTLACAVLRACGVEPNLVTSMSFSCGLDEPPTLTFTTLIENADSGEVESLAHTCTVA